MNATTSFLMILAQVCVSQQAKIVTQDGQPGDRFGVSVDMVQDRIVVGAMNARPPTVGTMTGAGYVFELVGGGWQEQAQLIPSKPIPKGEYGRSVACDGTKLVVGAPGAFPLSVPGTRGLVYVYSGAGSTWVEEAVLDPADPLAQNNFGRAVDIDGDTILVGAPGGGTAPAGPFGGVAFVFVRSGSTWNLEAKLVPSDSSDDAAYGHSVVVRGDTAIIGAPFADGGQARSGAVYVFTRTGTNWQEVQKLSASDGETDDRFGYSVALDGTALVIGAPWDDTGTWIDHGCGYVFEWDGQLWQEHQKLRQRGYLEGLAGLSVAVHQGKAVFGTPGEVSSPGSVFLYSRSNARWLEHFKLTSDDGFFGQGTGTISHVGESTVLKGQELVAGAPEAEGAIWPMAGAVYVFDIQMQDPRPTFYCVPKTDSRGCTPRFYHFRMPSVSAAINGHSYLIQGLDLQPDVLGMLLYSITGPANAPFAGGALCIQHPIRGTQAALTGPLAGIPQPCNGHFRYDFNAWIASGKDPTLTAGQPVWMQYWYRDPTGPPGANIGLTDGIFVVICP